MNQLEIIKDFFDKKGIKNKLVKVSNSEIQLTFTYDGFWNAYIKESAGTNFITVYKGIFKIRKDAKCEVCKIINEINGWASKYAYASFNCLDEKDGTVVFANYSLPQLKYGFTKALEQALESFFGDIEEAFFNELAQIEKYKIF